MEQGHATMSDLSSAKTANFRRASEQFGKFAKCAGCPAIAPQIPFRGEVEIDDLTVRRFE